ncbi:hypothetical protein HYU93_01805 [Candidatus Daviesbacteria bacterium]|nr:hypothetical protein [Candidatus Daviesbacteria bacterium]
MDTSGSITQFFYNIIPGSLFIIVFVLIVGYPPDLFYPLLQKNWVFSVFIFLSLALLVGFSFQVITKIDRKYPLKTNNSSDCLNKIAIFLNILSMKIHKRFIIRNLNNITWDKVKEDKTSYAVARAILKGLKVSGKKIFDEKDSDERLFYLMHNYLVAEHKDKQVDFYMGRIAFWANIYYGTLILMIVSLFLQRWEIFLFLLGFAVFNRCFAYHEYLRIQYDVVLKTFILVYKHDLKTR